MKIILLFMLLLTPNYQAEVTAYVEAFLHRVRLTRGFDTRREETLKLVPLVVKKSLEYDIDPLLTAVKAYRESSWQPNLTGRRGERGLLQVIPRYFKDHDLSKVEDQLDAGLSHLRKAIDICGGDVIQGLNYYGTAPPRCKPILPFAKARYRRYRLAVRRYRQ